MEMTSRIAFILLTIAILPSSILSRSFSKCPTMCRCDLDISGRYYTLCENGNMTELPTNQIDEKMEIIIIHNPGHTITIGNIFSSFRKLEILRIIDSSVPAIGMHSFWGVPSLRILDLSKNNITHINLDNFKGQEKLFELNLSGNKLGLIPSGTFTYLTSLRTLILTDNMITELVPRLFQQLKNLKHLDLSGNSLENISADVFRDIPELKTFKCRKCSLKRVNPKLFTMVRQLSEIDLGNNHFRQFENEFRELRSLKRLILDHNLMSVISEDVFNHPQKNLEYLDLSFNGMRNISEKAFIKLYNLTSLDLSYNKLSSSDMKSVLQIENLKILNISGNLNIDLTQTQSVFHKLEHLHGLGLADLNTIPSNFFHGLRHLRFLNISGTELKNDSLQLITPLSALETLDISRNKIRSFETEIVEILVNVNNVILDDNYLVCDVCSIGTLLDRMDVIKWENFPKCFYPPNLREKHLNRLQKEHLDYCLEFVADDVIFESAIKSFPYFLQESRLNSLAIAGATAFVLIILIIVISFSIFTHQTAHYYTKEDGKKDDNDKILEGSLMPNAEISFKFPLNEESIFTPTETLHSSPRLH